KIDPKVKFTDAVRANMTVDSAVIAMPASVEGIVLYANKALIDPTNLPSTLDDLLTQAKTFTKDNVSGLIMSQTFYNSAGIFFALHGTIFDGRGALTLTTGAPLKDYLNVLKDAAARASRGELALNVAPIAFENGGAAYLIDGSWKLTEYRGLLG